MRSVLDTGATVGNVVVVVVADVYNTSALSVNDGDEDEVGDNSSALGCDVSGDLEGPDEKDNVVEVAIIGMRDVVSAETASNLGVENISFSVENSESNLQKDRNALPWDS